MKQVSKVVALAISCLTADIAAGNTVSCSFTSISSDITVNTTLSAGTLYRIEGCVHVKAGYTLSIPAGTVVMFEKASHAGLVIDKGAYILVQGTDIAPVVFTSDQQPGSRSPGDYSGLLINGKATNNFPSHNMTTNDRTCNIDAGGTIDNDSSGMIRYLRIEFPESVTFASVGERTILEHIQVSYAEKSGFQFWGGTAQAQKLLAYNARANDFEFYFGNRSQIQASAGLRLDPAMHTGVPPFSNGIVIANNNDALHNFAGTPESHPILNKISLIHAGFCTDEDRSSNFKNAVLAFQNARMNIYNSVFTGWPTGLRLAGSETMVNATASPQLIQFEANTLHNHMTEYTHDDLWVTGGCASDMEEWITHTGACSQRWNELSPDIIGYDASVCEDLCGNNIPSFIMTGAPLGDTAFYRIPELATRNFFTPSGFRGAFDKTTDWTQDWTNFCPQNTAYCTEDIYKDLTGMQSIEPQDQKLGIFPNPAEKQAQAVFYVHEKGQVTLSVINPMGQTVRHQHHDAEKGLYKIPVGTDGLGSGLYIIKIRSTRGEVMEGKIVIP